MAEPNAFDFEFRSIDGEPLPLARFRGKPVLVVNTASFCGFTPQYQGMQALHERYGARGLVVLAVPSNDFGAQEPGSAQEIKSFCAAHYQVGFALASKEHVIGADAHPFYRWIAAELGEAGQPRWNFHKYLLAPDGTLVGAWPSSVDPQQNEITAAIEGML